MIWFLPRRYGVLLGILFSCLFLPSAALAETGPIALNFSDEIGSGICPGEVDLRNRVSALLGEKAFDDDSERRVNVRFLRQAEHIVATIQLRSSKDDLIGARTMEAGPDQCGFLASAVSLNLALAIDPAKELDAELVDRPIEPTTISRGFATGDADAVAKTGASKAVNGPPSTSVSPDSTPDSSAPAPITRITSRPLGQKQEQAKVEDRSVSEPPAAAPTTTESVGTTEARIDTGAAVSVEQERTEDAVPLTLHWSLGPLLNAGTLPEVVAGIPSAPKS